MNIVKKDIDQLNAIITIELTKPDYEEKVNKTLHDYRKKANIPGFRPGMVPFGLIQKMYGKAVLGEEINKILSEKLYDYIKENNLNTLGEPLPNETEQKEINFDTDDTFEFAFDVALAPEFDLNLNKKDKVKYYDIEVTDEMIDNQIKSFAGRFGNYTQENEVVENDVLKGELIEMEGSAAKENGLKIEDATLSPLHIKDAEQKKLFIGVKKGDTVIFNPQKAFENETEISSLLKISKEDAKNQTSDFCYEIKGITRYNEAQINQELFDKVYGVGNVKNEEEFRTKVTEGIKENLAQDVAYKFGIDAKDMIMKKMENLSFPDAFLKRWVLASNEKMTSETLDADYPKMIDELKWHLAKEKIAKANNLQVDAPEVENYAKTIAKMQFAQYGLTGVEDAMLENYAKEMLKKEDQVKGIVDRVLENKVFEIIKNSVGLDNKTISLDKFNKLFEEK